MSRLCMSVCVVIEDKTCKSVLSVEPFGRHYKLIKRTEVEIYELLRIKLNRYTADWTCVS